MSITSFSPEHLIEEVDFTIKNPAILCVDDEQFILDSLYNILEKRFGSKYQYEFAESAEEALSVVEALDKEGATLVMAITDRVMPGMSGDEFLEKLHITHPKTIKILLTGQASTESAINAINNVDLFKYLTKPWDANGFLNTLEQGLDHYFLDHSTTQKMHIFNKLVPNELLNTITPESMPDLAFDEITAKEMTLLYVDVKSLTPAIENLPRVDADHKVKAFINLVETTLKQHNGYCDKRIGAPVTGLFQNSTQALNCAKQLKQQLTTFKDTHNAPLLAETISVYTGYLMLEDTGMTMDKGITHQSIQLSEAINKLCQRYQASTLVSNTTMTNFNLKKHDYRWVATLQIAPLDQTQKLYELLDPQNPKDAVKIETKQDFEAALSTYFTQDIVKAEKQFNALARDYPLDPIFQYYLEQCRVYLSKKPESNWIATVPIQL